MSMIICPKCKSLLQQSGKMLKCAEGHTYDFSKEGYVNLLLANQKNSNNPGDNKSMINARESFLSQGHYNFLIEKIESVVKEYYDISKVKTLNMLDLGCGSGYYTRSIFKKEISNKLGIDISKVAVAKAAKKDKASLYVVASNFDLPVAASSIDLLFNIFSPLSLMELSRVLKPEGLLIKVIPTGNHMKEVAEKVYENFIPHESNIESKIEADDSFTIVQVESLESRILLAGQELHDFISMTPYFYKFKDGQLEAIAELLVTLSFELIVAKRMSMEK